MAIKRINVTMEESHIAKIDQYAKEMSISRSAAIAVLTGQALEYRQLIGSLPEMMDFVRRTAADASEAETGVL